MWNLFSNTVAGAAAASVNIVKLAAVAPLSVLDEGKAATDAIDGISKGVRLIGSSKSEEASK
jgi:hypothetical protein